MNGILKNIRKISLLTIMFNILKSMTRFHFLKRNVRPAQKFEFDMHGLNVWWEGFNLEYGGFENRDIEFPMT